MLRKILLSSPALLCVESFWITVSVSSVVIGLFRLFASSWLSFGRSHLSRNLSLSPSLSNVLAFFFFFTVLCIAVVSVVIAPLPFLIVFMWILSFRLDEDAWRLIGLAFLFKAPVPGFIELWIVLSVCMLFHCALVFVISFLLLSLGCLCCFSSSSCANRLRLFIGKVSLLDRSVLL